MSTIFVVDLLPPILPVFLHLLVVVMYNSDTPFLLACAVDPCLRDQYIYYYSFIPPSFPDLVQPEISPTISFSSMYKISFFIVGIGPILKNSSNAFINPVDLIVNVF